MDASQISFSEFQSFVSERYGDKDRERGTSRTFMWFMEEVGELASALQNEQTGERNQELAGEFADVLGWLTTLANMEGINLTEAIWERYIRDGGRNHKV